MSADCSAINECTDSGVIKIPHKCETYQTCEKGDLGKCKGKGGQRGRRGEREREERGRGGGESGRRIEMVDRGGGLRWRTEIEMEDNGG